MKAEVTSQTPAFNLTKPDGTSPQTNAKTVTKVFLTNGMEYDIVPGSFNYFVTPGDRPVPFIQFKALTWVDNDNDEIITVADRVLHTFEFFPASVAGVGYPTEDEKVRAPEQVG